MACTRQQVPEESHHNTHGDSKVERPPPSPVGYDPTDQRRSQGGAGSHAPEDDTVGDSPFLGRNPTGHQPVGCGEHDCFARSEKEAHQNQQIHRPGHALTPPLITWIIVNWGWRWSLFLRVHLGIVVALVWYLLARDTPRAHPWASQKKEIDHMKAGIPAGARGAASRAGPLPSGTSVPGNKDILFVTLSYFGLGYSAWIFWFYKYLKDVRGLDLKASAFYSMLPFLGMAPLLAPAAAGSPSMLPGISAGALRMRSQSCG